MNPSVNLGRSQRGVSIITAIFMLLLFSALAGLMANLVSSANITSTQDVLGGRTLQAAQAGVERGLFLLDPNGETPGLPACFADISMGEIAGYAVTVKCTPYPGAAAFYAEAGRTIRIYEIVATATATGSSPVIVEREVKARVEKCRDTTISAAPYDC